MKRKVVCLCGSTRFWREFQKASLKETLAGNIVLSIGAASGTDDEHFGNMPREEYARVKNELDRLHFDKIEMSDEVLILNVGGYIGESTANELMHARHLGKTIRFLEDKPYITLQQAMFMVSDFHDKVAGRVIEPMTRQATDCLMHSWGDDAVEMSESALRLFKDASDPRFLRAHLILEETGELLRAMASGNELNALDALADLLYVLIGTAVTLDLPLPEAFVEVHRSNMTKEKQADDPDGARVRSKGPNYSPPDLKTILDNYRRLRDVSMRSVSEEAGNACPDTDQHTQG